MLLIQNATNDWTKPCIFFFYPHYIGESTKLLKKKQKNSVMQCAREITRNPVRTAYASYNAHVS